MILLYQLPDTDKGRLVKAFFERIKKDVVEAGKEQAGWTPEDLFAGKSEANPVEDAPSDSAVFFSAEEQEADAREMLELLSQAGVRFRFQVLVDECNARRTVADILREQAEHQELLKTLRHLHELIDRCDQLNQEDYDPDRWSELKFAIADANETLAAVFADQPEGVKVGKTQLEERTQALGKRLERMLTYRRPE